MDEIEVEPLEPDLLAKVVPNYPPGAKRLVRDNGVWATTLKRQNVHLISDADHFMFGEGNTRIWNLLRGWLGDYFPATAATVKKVAAAH